MRAIELAALAGFSDPRPFSIRQLERAARVKRREEWDRLAFLRLDLRKMLRRNADDLLYCDFNPTYSEEERASIRAKARKEERDALPKIGAKELYEALKAK